MCVCVCVCACVCVCVCVCVCACVCVCMRMPVCMASHVYFIYVYKLNYACTHLHSTGDSLETETRQYFRDTLGVMSEHFKAYKDPSIFRVFTRNTGNSYLVLLLLVLVSIVTLR